MFERPQSGERAVLVHVNFRNVPDADSRELSELAYAAGAEAVALITHQRDKPDPKYYIGKGKLAEIQQTIQFHNAEVVIFNHDLSPSQERNIEKEVKCRVISRTGLILDIFAKRARTFEGKLQVELAQLEYLSTRLVRGWTHLERQKGGIGLRGPGETQLETDRRLLRERLVIIGKRLEKVKKQRQQSRHARTRANVLTVTLVGYTNAGKSTLFNMLTGAEVLVANQLFATLDPTLRAIELNGVGKVVLADTVGFIRQLPHTLVDAFRATLEETADASLILHIVDAHDEKYEDNIAEVNNVLKEIGADDVPQIMVFNKSDLLPEPYCKGIIEQDKIWVSALKGIGLDLLREALQGRLSNERVCGTIVLSPAQGQLRSQLYALKAVLKERETEEGGWEIAIELTKNKWEEFCQKHHGLAEVFSQSEEKR